MLLFCSCVAAAVVLPLFCSALRYTMNASCTVPVHVLRDAEGRDHWVVARESYDSALMEIACKGIAERIDPSSKAQDIVVAEASLGSRRDHLPQGLHPVLEQMQAHLYPWMHHVDRVTFSPRSHFCTLAIGNNKRCRKLAAQLAILCQEQFATFLADVDPEEEKVYFWKPEPPEMPDLVFAVGRRHPRPQHHNGASSSSFIHAPLRIEDTSCASEEEELQGVWRDVIRTPEPHEDDKR